MPCLGVQPDDLADAIGLGRDNLGEAVGVEDLGANRVVVDQLADGNQAGRSRDQSVVDHARRHLLRRACSHVEPHRGIEAEDLVQQHPRQFVGEDLGVVLGGEVAVLEPGAVVDAHHSVDELAQAGLTLRRAGGTAEVLAGDDVRGVDRPELGELHAALLEVHRAVAPVRHHDVAALPGDLVVGVHAGGGVHPLDGQPPALRAAGLPSASRGGGGPGGLGHALPFLAAPPWGGGPRSAHAVQKFGCTGSGAVQVQVRGAGTAVPLRRRCGPGRCGDA